MEVDELEWTDERLQQFWSYWGDKVHTYFAEQHGEAIVHHASKWIRSGAVCVNFGCGSGGLTAALLSGGYKVASVDVSIKSIDAVARRFAGIDEFLGAWLVDQLPDAEMPKADAVFSVETIEHILPAHLDDYFLNMRRLIDPDGIVIFTTPNNEDIEAAKVFCPESGAVFHPMQHLRSFDQAGICELLKQNGFEPITVFVTDFGVSFLKTPKQWAANRAKRILGMGMPPPHLVCLARIGTS